MSNNCDENLKGLEIDKRTYKENMEEYDSYPPEIREFIRNCPYNLNVRYFDLPKIIKDVRFVTLQNIIETYGPTHPQIDDLLDQIVS